MCWERFHIPAFTFFFSKLTSGTSEFVREQHEAEGRKTFQRSIEMGFNTLHRHKRTVQKDVSSGVCVPCFWCTNLRKFASEMKVEQSLLETWCWLPQQPVWADVRTKDSSAAAEAVTLSLVLTSFRPRQCGIGLNTITCTTSEHVRSVYLLPSTSCPISALYCLPGSFTDCLS